MNYVCELLAHTTLSFPTLRRAIGNMEIGICLIDRSEIDHMRAVLSFAGKVSRRSRAARSHSSLKLINQTIAHLLSAQAA